MNERLRHLGGTAKLALDVLQFEERLERAFTFICGCAARRVDEMMRFPHLEQISTSTKSKDSSLEDTPT